MASSSSNSLELNLSLKVAYMPKTIQDILKELSEFENDSSKLSVLDAYISQHEEEANNISAFERQLPFCVVHLNEALKRLKDEHMKIKNGMKSKNNENPDFMEFLGLKRKHSEAEATPLALAQENYGNKGKSTLMSLASPLPWNHQNKKQQQFIDFIKAPNSNKKQQQFIDFIKAPNNNKNLNTPSRGINLGLSIGGKAGATYINGAHQQDSGLNPKPKARKCWTPDLHARFVEALDFLGGIEVATPKQINDLMKGDDLTNDQVKSHLQKYRLHCRRPPPLSENHAVGRVNVQGLPNYFGYPFAITKYSEDQHNSNREGSLNKKF